MRIEARQVCTDSRCFELSVFSASTNEKESLPSTEGKGKSSKPCMEECHPSARWNVGSNLKHSGGELWESKGLVR